MSEFELFDFKSNCQMSKRNPSGVECEQTFGLFWMNRYPIFHVDKDGYCL